MKLVLATRNRDKVSEIRALLSRLDVEIVTLDAYPDLPETIEDADTLRGNALKKAREVRARSGLSALADDTGLEVHALDGAPGVHAARYAGPGATYADNCNKLLAEMRDVPVAERRARFRTVIAVALSRDDAARARGEARNSDALVCEGVLPGSIATEKRGTHGFGYDPVFIDSESGRTLAEMSPEEKNASSHRSRALLEAREMMLREGLVTEQS